MTSTAVFNVCGLAATAGHWQMRTRPDGVTLEGMTHPRDAVDHPPARVLRGHGDVGLADAAVHVRDARIPDE